MRLYYKILALSVSVALVTACQSVPNSSAQTLNSSSVQAVSEEVLRARLNQALKNHMRSNFSYQSQILMDNDERLQALQSASTEQLAASDVADERCEHEHDAAYVELMKKAGTLDTASLVSKHALAMQTIKDNYLACRKALWDSYGLNEEGLADDVQTEDGESTLNDRDLNSSDLNVGDLNSSDLNGSDLNDGEHSATEDTAVAAAAAVMRALGSDLKMDDELNQTESAGSAQNLSQDENCVSDVAAIERYDDNEGAYEGNQDGYDAQHTKLDLKKAKLAKAYLFDSLTVSVVGNYRPLVGYISILPQATYRAKNVNMMINQPIVISLKDEAIYLWADNLALANASYLDDELGDKWQGKWLKLPINDGSLPKDFAKDVIQSYVKAREKIMADSAVEMVGMDALPSSLKLQSNLGADSIVRVRKPAELSTLRYFYDEMSQKYPSLVQATSACQTLDQAAHDAENTPTVEAAIEDVHQHLNSHALMQQLFAVIDSRTSSTAPMLDLHRDEYYGLKGNTVVWQATQAQAQSKQETVAVYQLTQFYPKIMSEFDRLPAQSKMPNAHNTVDVMDYGNDLIDRIQKSDNVINQTVAGLLFALLGVDLQSSGQDSSDYGQDSSDY